MKIKGRKRRFCREEREGEKEQRKNWGRRDEGREGEEEREDFLRVREEGRDGEERHDIFFVRRRGVNGKRKVTDGELRELYQDGSESGKEGGLERRRKGTVWEIKNAREKSRSTIERTGISRREEREN